MTAPAADEPVDGYDGLKTRDLIASLSNYSRAELAAIERYERAHRIRGAVLSKLRRLRHGNQRLQEQRALSTDEVVATLRRLRLAGSRRSHAT
jgi:hypothetical protein